MNMNDEENLSKFDHSNYDVIVFDEIYFSSIQKLHTRKQFCIDNPDKIIIATGDTSQLPPITDYTNTKIYADYADECINNIFQYEICLKENKRLKTQEDKDKLKQFKTELFNKKNINHITTIKTYFQFTENITTSMKNIAYKNDTCKEVSKHIRKKLNKTDEYEVGEVLICREYLKL